VAVRYTGPVPRARLVRLCVALTTLAILATLSAVACGVPLGAIRRSPPSGIDARIVARGAAAPPFTLDGTGGTFRLAEVLATQHVLLVFYRGHW
jgi:hypothetical protein